MAIGLGTRSSDRIRALWQRMDEFSHAREDTDTHIDPILGIGVRHGIVIHGKLFIGTFDSREGKLQTTRESH